MFYIHSFSSSFKMGFYTEAYFIGSLKISVPGSLLLIAPQSHASPCCPQRGLPKAVYKDLTFSLQPMILCYFLDPGKYLFSVKRNLPYSLLLNRLGSGVLCIKTLDFQTPLKKKRKAVASELTSQRTKAEACSSRLLYPNHMPTSSSSALLQEFGFVNLGLSFRNNIQESLL